MRVRNAFLSLPSSLLLLLATQLQCIQADDDTSAAAAGERRRNNDYDNGDDSATAALPTAVRKMSPHEGEKFMPGDFAFAPLKVLISNDDDLGGSNVPRGLLFTLDNDKEEASSVAFNDSTVLAFSPPFPRHYDLRRGASALEKRRKEEGENWSLYRRTSEVLTRLRRDRRSFMCPGGTHVCSNINEPDYCCTDGTTCFEVEDAPNSGNVGCCPDGQTCGGSVAACADGNTACPAEAGGGCCVAGFVCADIGCVQAAPTATSTPSTQPTTTPPPSTSSTSSPTTSNNPPNTETGTGLPPVRPTSSLPTTSPSPSPSPSYCPTGFYGCLATAGSGCCRTGRDCQTTSCPPAIPSTTIIATHGLTIVVPLSDAEEYTATATAATCAGGWFLCSDRFGPGCCPSGYVCGIASCTLSAVTATATVQKERPGGNGTSAAAGGPSMTLMMMTIVLTGWAVVAPLVFI